MNKSLILFSSVISTVTSGANVVTLPQQESIDLFDAANPNTLQLLLPEKKFDSFYPSIELKFPPEMLNLTVGNFITTLSLKGLCDYSCGTEVGVSQSRGSSIKSGTLIKLCLRMRVEVDSGVEMATYSCGGSPDKLHIISPCGNLSHMQFTF